MPKGMIANARVLAKIMVKEKWVIGSKFQILSLHAGAIRKWRAAS
jgi:hypothetical protein